MTVVATGMHHTWRFGSIVHTRGLMNWQGIHIGTQTDHPARSIGFAFDHRHHTSSANTRCHIRHAKTLQLVLHKSCGLVHLIHQFRVFMQMAPPSGDFLLQVSETVFDRQRCNSSQLR